MKDENSRLVDHILQVATNIFETVGISVPQEWLSSDLTVTQLRVLLMLQTAGSCRMSEIAAGMGVALPTATGVVDHLVAKELVIREADPRDRRVVMCRLSPGGRELIGKLWEFSRLQLEQLIRCLDTEELARAAEVVDILYKKISQSKQCEQGRKNL